MLLKRRCLLSAPATGASASGERVETKMSEKTAVNLFTPEEHRILSEWLDTKPHCPEGAPTLETALERLGFGEELAAPYYTDVDAAVAFIVLESVEKRLPQWAAVDRLCSQPLE